MHSSLRCDDAAAVSGRATRVQKQRFARDQYVRVQLNGNRTEIGVVAEVNETEGTITVTTRHGYDVTVRPEAVHRAFLVVLDLNGVLGARNRVGFKPRPHVVDFVKFVFNNFAVAVWTSGLERTCAPIIEAVFDGYQDRLLFTLFREACTPRPTLENPHGTFKDLQRIFDSYPQSFHSVNTIIIDDSPDKCSHPDIALCPIPFKDTPEQAHDVGLVKVVEVLQEVLDTDSIHPLIRAAEERLAVLRSTAPSADATLLTLAAEPNPAIEAPIMTTITDSGQAQAHEITLWRTRLCCDNLRGCCRSGSDCQYSHDMDDGKRPCSRKNKCRFGHANRWVPTAGDDLVERRQREQARFADRSDRFFLSKEELAAVQGSGRSHTGIPRLDAQNESLLMGNPVAPHRDAISLPAPRSTATGSIRTSMTNATFSTNPRAVPQQAVHHNSSAIPTNVHGYPTRPTGGVDVSHLLASPAMQTFQSPQPQQQGGSQRGSEWRLHGDQEDGTALIKQLEMLTRR